jgi:hypothetical protein
MRAGLDPFSFLVVSMAGWINERQQQVIEFLVEENRVLREQIGSRRMRFTDDQRRRLAARAKKLGRKVLAQVVTIVTGDSASLASKVDCQEIRWEHIPELGPTGDSNREEYRLSVRVEPDTLHGAPDCEDRRVDLPNRFHTRSTSCRRLPEPLPVSTRRSHPEVDRPLSGEVKQ